MDNVIIIAAIGKNNELGKNNNLIWTLPNDLKFFKENTTNHTVVMGYNTVKSLPKILPNRKNIVVTTKDIEIDNVLIFHNIESLLEYINNTDELIYIIGGYSMYKYFIEYANTMLLTEIDAEDKDADTYFPNFDKSNWNIEILKENRDNNIKYRHVRYRRK